MCASFYLSVRFFFVSLLLSPSIFIPFALKRRRRTEKKKIVYKKHAIKTAKKWCNRCKYHGCVYSKQTDMRTQRGMVNGECMQHSSPYSDRVFRQKKKKKRNVSNIICSQDIILLKINSEWLGIKWMPARHIQNLVRLRYRTSGMWNGGTQY